MMASKLYNAFQLIRKGHVTVFLKEFKKRFNSYSVFFGIQRELTNEFQSPSPKIEIQICPQRKNDVAELLHETIDTSIIPQIFAHHKSILHANIPTCYVAVTTDTKPCHMQWLIGYDDNQRIEKYFNGVFPQLKKYESHLKVAYSNAAYQGLQIITRSMALIAEKAADINARWVNTFIDITNIGSLKERHRSGFKPYLLWNDRWFLFRRTTTFHPISDRMIDRFYKVTDSDRYKTSDKHQIPMTNHTPKVV